MPTMCVELEEVALLKGRTFAAFGMFYLGMCFLCMLSMQQISVPVCSLQGNVGTWLDHWVRHAVSCASIEVA